MASVRYIVEDVEKAVQFYRDLLGFSIEMHQPGKFASLRREDLNLFLNAAGAEALGKLAEILNRAAGPGSWSSPQT